MRALVAAIVLAVPMAQSVAGEVWMAPEFGGAPLRPEELALVTDQGQTIEIARLDFLATEFALQREDGIWEAAAERAAFCSLSKQRGRIAAGTFAGRYKAARFLIGVTPELNKGDPAQYAADHPLNPNINGLHWGWAGGYVFAAIEGRWRGRGDRLHGFSFHLANDENLTRIELPFAPAEVGKLTIRFDLARVFSGLWLDPRESSTHSRAGDPLAKRLRGNLQGAFSVGANVPATNAEPARGAVVALISPTAKPYPFTFPAYFPKPALPLDNPLTQEGVELGRRLFHDPQLSGNGTQTCASCHRADRGFADPARESRGAEGRLGTRNAMALTNLAWKTEFFWDGRARSLREQVLMPIQDPAEMHAKLPEVIARISTGAYRSAFTAAFGTPEVNADRIARALEQFVLTLVAANSKFDDVMRGQAKFTEEEQRGFELFHTEFDPRRDQFGADCFHCHGGPLFRNMEYANNGLNFESRDQGRALVTKRPADDGKFAVPSLRNVARTAPYMHDGRFRDLGEVMGFYERGVRPARNLDPNLAKHPPQGLHLPREDRRALVAFLETLTERQ